MRWYRLCVPTDPAFPFSAEMTPPTKWYLEKEGDDVIVCVSSLSEPAASPVNHGILRDIRVGTSKGKQVLKVNFSMDLFCHLAFYWSKHD